MYSICRGINHGDEIGMVDVVILPEHVQDPWEKIRGFRARATCSPITEKGHSR
jgi:hypothetical protein